jgi:hypothetical protein
MDAKASESKKIPLFTSGVDAQERLINLIERQVTQGGNITRYAEYLLIQAKPCVIYHMYEWETEHINEIEAVATQFGGKVIRESLTGYVKNEYKSLSGYLWETSSNVEIIREVQKEYKIEKSQQVVLVIEAPDAKTAKQIAERVCEVSPWVVQDTRIVGVSEESVPPNFQEAIANIKRDDKGQKLVVLTQTIEEKLPLLFFLEENLWRLLPI